MNLPESLIRRFALLGILQIVARALSATLPLPNWNVSEEVRAWVKKLIPLLSDLSSRTITTLDDASVSLVRTVVESDELWPVVWAILNDLQTRSPTEEDRQRLAEACARASQTGAIDPVTIMAMIQLIMEIVALWRQRRRAQPAPEPDPSPTPIL